MKLTLSLDKETIEFAHKLAQQSNDSISNMVETFLQNAQRNHKDYRPDHPAVKHLFGLYKNNPLPNKKAMREALLKKHLR